YMKVTVTDAEATTLGTASVSLDGRYTDETKATMTTPRAKSHITIELEEETDITVTLSKESGADPVMSWLGIREIVAEDEKTGVYLNDEEKTDYDTAINEAIADTTKEHTIQLYSDATTAQRSNLTVANNITIKNGTYGVTLKQTSSNMMFLAKSVTSDIPVISFGKSEEKTTDEKLALTIDANSKKRIMEGNKGTINLYHGTVITGGKDARGGAFDLKASSTMNMAGGIITGNTATDASGGGAISVMKSAKFNMTGGTITGNTSDTNTGGGISLPEAGAIASISGGSIKNNTGYDVYFKDGTLNLSGSADIGTIYVAAGKAVQVNASFDKNASHATIIPESYTNGTTVVTYSNGLTPSLSDFTLQEKDGYMLYVDGQNLKIKSTNTPVVTLPGDMNEDGKLTAVDALLIMLTSNPSDEVIAKGDITGDGILNQEDAAKVLSEATQK
ncbi:MAG: hypothetical protein ACI4CT_00535, partial [Lachnospiraceae bacterium]